MIDIPRTGIIIQARMTSSRFPGKVIAPLHGIPVIHHVLNNLAQVPLIDEVAVAIPTGEAHKKLAASITLYNKMYGKDIKVIYGDEENVLSRYYFCARVLSLDYIVRITADCPYIDPAIVVKVLRLLKSKNLDYASNVFPQRTFSKGLDVEAFTFDCLEAAYIMNSHVPIEIDTFSEIKDAGMTELVKTQEFPNKIDYNQEHVTPWMQEEDEVKKGCIVNKNKAKLLNLCVDYPEDIKRLEKLDKKVLKDIVQQRKGRLQ